MKINRSQVFLPKKIYNEMYINDNLDALAFYIIIKKIYKNGIIFNASNKKVAGLAKVSESTARKHIITLIKYDLIKKRGNDIIFVNPMKLTRYANKKGVIKASYFSILNNYKNQKIFLKSFAFLCNIKAQERVVAKVIKSNKDLMQERNYSLFKKAHRYLSKKQFITNYVTLSNRSFCKKVNKSTPTIQRYKKTLINEGILISKQKFKKFDISLEHLRGLRKAKNFLDFKLNRLRVIDGKVYQQLTNEYTLMNNPVQK